MFDALPIASKELAQPASRKQTYVLRIVYLVTLFLFFYTTYRDITQIQELTRQLGRGSALFQTLYFTQIMLLIFAVPPLVASAISSEREKNTFEILMTLPLSAYSILLQKLFSRLIPVFAIVFIGLPLFGMAYALGGVAPYTIVLCTANYLIIATFASLLALALSATMKSSVSAIITFYVILVVPTYMFMGRLTPQYQTTSRVVATFLLFSVLGAILLVIARLKLTQQPRNKPVSGRKKFLAKLRERNVHVAHHGLPKDQHPICWLEQIKSAFRYRTSLIFCILAATPFYLLTLGDDILFLFLFFLTMLGIGVSVFFRYQHAALQLRQNPILPTLLTTPTAPNTLIAEFMRGRRYVQHQSITLILLVCTAGTIGLRDEDIFFIFFGVATAGVLYLVTLGWFATGISLFTRTTLQAVGYGLGITIVTVFVLPQFLPGPVLWNPLYYAYELLDVSAFLTTNGPYTPERHLLIPLHIACCTAVLLALRIIVIKIAPRLLLRAANKH